MGDLLLLREIKLYLRVKAARRCQSTVRIIVADNYTVINVGKLACVHPKGVRGYATSRVY